MTRYSIKTKSIRALLHLADHRLATTLALPAATFVLATLQAAGRTCVEPRPFTPQALNHRAKLRLPQDAAARV